MSHNDIVLKTLGGQCVGLIIEPLCAEARSPLNDPTIIVLYKEIVREIVDKNCLIVVSTQELIIELPEV